MNIYTHICIVYDTQTYIYTRIMQAYTITQMLKNTKSYVYKDA